MSQTTANGDSSKSAPITPAATDDSKHHRGVDQQQQRRHRLLPPDKGGEPSSSRKKGSKTDEERSWLFWGRSRVQTYPTNTQATHPATAGDNKARRIGTSRKSKGKNKKNRGSTTTGYSTSTTRLTTTPLERTTTTVSASLAPENPINSTYEGSARGAEATSPGTSPAFRTDESSVESSTPLLLETTSLFSPRLMLPGLPTSPYSSSSSSSNATHETAFLGSGPPSSIMPSVVHRHHGPRVINVTIYPEGTWDDILNAC